MIHCPECEADQLRVIDTETPSKGKYTRRRLKCKVCESRFTSHEIRETDLADSSSNHFSQILNKIRSEAKIPKPFRKALRPKPKRVRVGRSWFLRCLESSHCCSDVKEFFVNR